jgi:hypothetical protein
LNEAQQVNNASASINKDNATSADKKIFTVYPNPAKEIINIRYNGNAQFILADHAGKTILTKIVENTGAINVRGFAAGLYYLKNAATRAVQKIIVAR